MVGLALFGTALLGFVAGSVLVNLGLVVLGLVRLETIPGAPYIYTLIVLPRLSGGALAAAAAVWLVSQPLLPKAWRARFVPIVITALMTALAVLAVFVILYLLRATLGIGAHVHDHFDWLVGTNTSPLFAMPFEVGSIAAVAASAAVAAWTCRQPVGARSQDELAR